MMRRIVLSLLIAGAVVLPGCYGPVESREMNTGTTSPDQAALTKNDQYDADIAFMAATRQLYVDIESLLDDIDSAKTPEGLVSVLKKHQNSARRWSADVSALEGARYPHDFEKSRSMLFKATKTLDDGLAMVIAATSSENPEELIQGGLDEVWRGHDQMGQALKEYYSERESAKKKWGIGETPQ